MSSSHHRRRRVLAVVAVAAGAVVAGTAWGLGAGSPQAAANGTDGQFCVANEVTATMVRQTWNPGLRASRSYGAIQVRARPGEACHLAGAPRATLQGTATRTTSDESAPRTVVVRPETPAWIPLDWDDEASPSAQQIPRSITIDLNGSPLVVPWTGGGVDSVDPADPIAVRGVQSGTAPYSYGT